MNLYHYLNMIMDIVPTRFSYSYGMICIDKKNVANYLDDPNNYDLDDVIIVMVECKVRYSFIEMLTTTLKFDGNVGRLFEKYITPKLKHSCTKLERRFLNLLFLSNINRRRWTKYCYSLAEIVWGADNNESLNKARIILNNFEPVVTKIQLCNDTYRTAKKYIDNLETLDSMWEFPKGHKLKDDARNDKREHDVQAAVREFIEETRISPLQLSNDLIGCVLREKTKGTVKYMLKYYITTIDLDPQLAQLAQLAQVPRPATNMMSIIPHSPLSTVLLDTVIDDDIIDNRIENGEVLSTGLFSIKDMKRLSTGSCHKIFDICYSRIRNILTSTITRWYRDVVMDEYDPTCEQKNNTIMRRLLCSPSSLTTYP